MDGSLFFAELSLLLFLTASVTFSIFSLEKEPIRVHISDDQLHRLYK